MQKPKNSCYIFGFVKLLIELYKMEILSLIIIKLFVLMYNKIMKFIGYKSSYDNCVNNVSEHEFLFRNNFKIIIKNINFIIIMIKFFV